MWSKILLLTCLTVLIGCEAKKQDTKNRIREYVDKELRNFENQRMKVCREVALENATKIVDSLLIVRAYLEKDTLGKPPKPEKPAPPQIKTPLDSAPVKPLFDG